jgi:hypothetical protein
LVLGRIQIEAAFNGAALVATSVWITTQVLAAKGLLPQRASRIIMAAAIIDDVLGPSGKRAAALVLFRGLMAAERPHACGIVLIAAGVLAIPIPVIPGIPLIVAGAAMLGSDHPRVHSGWSWLRSRGILTQERNQNELSNVQG